MGDEDEFQVGVGMVTSVVFKNGYGYGSELLKPIPDLLVKGNQNTVAFKNKCRHKALSAYCLFM